MGRYAWAVRQGGVLAESTSARVTLRAASDAGAEIQGISTRVINRRTPPLGSVVTCGGRGEAPSVRNVSIDLDLTSDDMGAALPCRQR